MEKARTRRWAAHGEEGLQSTDVSVDRIANPRRDGIYSGLHEEGHRESPSSSDEDESMGEDEAYDRSSKEEEPGILFQMFLLPDVIVRWFDIEYQARCYALLHTARPHPIHVLSFVAFIISFFSVTAALSNLTKNVTLLLVSLLLCGTFYNPLRFRLLVVVSLIFFWLAGHALVSLFGAYIVKQSYVAVVTLSVFINILGHLNSDLFWG